MLKTKALINWLFENNYKKEATYLLKIAEDEFDPAEPFEVAGIKFDSEEGIGSFPNNKDINYLGFAVWMTADDFLKLNPSREMSERPDSEKFFEESIQNEKSFGPITLYVKQLDDGNLEVIGHEGRGRAMMIKRRDSKALIPVHIISAGSRAKHFNGLDLIGKSINSDHRSRSPFQFQISRVTHDKKNYGN